MNTKVIIAIIALAALGFATFMLLQDNDAVVTAPDTVTEDQSASEATSESLDTTDNEADVAVEAGTASGDYEVMLPLEDIAFHNTEEDCYTAIDGVIYDLTAWINQHPGGDRNILRLCGIDGSEAFNQQHGDNQNAKNTLAGFEIGIVVE